MRQLSGRHSSPPRRSQTHCQALVVFSFYFYFFCFLLFFFFFFFLFLFLTRVFVILVLLICLFPRLVWVATTATVFQEIDAPSSPDTNLSLRIGTLGQNVKQETSCRVYFIVAFGFDFRFIHVRFQSSLSVGTNKIRTHGEWCRLSRLVRRRARCQTGGGSRKRRRRGT